MNAERTGDGESSRPRRRWGRRAAWGLLALLVLAAALVATAPATLVVRIVERTDAPLRLYAPAGRLWSGSADAELDGEPLGRLAWRFDPAQLSAGRLGVRLRLEDDAHRLTAAAGVDVRGRLHVERGAGVIGEPSLDRLLAPYAIDPAGTVTLNETTATVVEGVLATADGSARWSGGRVLYRLGGQRFAVAFPPLHARLDVRADRPVLTVEDGSDRPLLDVTLDAEGWAHLRIRYRFVALAGFPWGDPPPQDTVVLELSEQIFTP